MPDAAIIPVSRSAMGQIWRLDVGAARNEAELTAHLETAGIRLPASVPGPGGCFVARLPADSGGGWVRLYRRIDGVPVDLADAAVAARIGSLLGRLHALRIAAAPRGLSLVRHLPDPAAWDQLADSALAHRAPGAAPLAQRTGLLRELPALVTPRRANH